MKSILQYNYEDSWLNIGDTSRFEAKNHKFLRTKEDDKFPGLSQIRTFRNPEYLAYASYVLFGLRLLPFQSVIQEQLWTHPFSILIASRGLSKTFSIALYSMLRAALIPETKIILTGAAFRQSIQIFQYTQAFWEGSGVIRSIFTKQNDGPRISVDRCVMRLGSSSITAIPLGDGQKIRGLRASIIVSDEFNSMPVDTYEEVVQGFAAVSQNVVENVIQNATNAYLIDSGLVDEHHRFENIRSNQNIISGTCGYYFQPLYEYWQKYKDIICSRGNKRRLLEILGGEIPKGFDWKDYCVIRIPHTLAPDGFMDEKVMARAKATVQSHIFMHEYAACFSKDSDGFFRRSLIESCVANNKNVGQPNWPSWCPQTFSAKTIGNQSSRYVMGIDPAAERDNLAIVIQELFPEHSRVVYCWTTNVENFKDRQKRKLTEESDYYKFCARKIRDLMKAFPCDEIGIDAQHGLAIIEALHDKDKLLPGEVPIWPVIDENKEKDTDGQPGLHILRLVQFANAAWTSESNHGLKKDLHDKVLLFPQMDSVELEIAATMDLARIKEHKEKFDQNIQLYDTLEDAVLNIEELKEELSTIVMTPTGTGVNARERWSTPEVKLSNHKKGYLRKDRYSALVISNSIARNIKRALPQSFYASHGMIVGENTRGKSGQMYVVPDTFKSINSQGYRAI